MRTEFEGRTFIADKQTDMHDCRRHNIAQTARCDQYLETSSGETTRQARLDLSPLLSVANIHPNAQQFCTEPRNPPFDKGDLAEQMVRDMRDAIANGAGGEWSYGVHNYNRSIGARLWKPPDTSARVERLSFEPLPLPFLA